MKAIFEQAGIPIQKEQEFRALKESIERLLSPALIEKFLSKLDKKGVRIRDFEKIRDQKLMEAVDENLAKSGKTAKVLYDAMSVTDQGQLREFYLTKIEEVGPELRHKYHKLYSYY